MKYLLALFIFQGTNVDEARRLDRDRIAAKKPLTTEQKAEHTPLSKLDVFTRRAARSIRADIIRVSFPDEPLKMKDWKGRVFDKVAAYYKRQSRGIFRLTAKLRPMVKARVRRSVMAKMPLAGDRESAALISFYAGSGASSDTAIFVLAGKPGKRNSALWPHQGTFTLGDRGIAYVLVTESVLGYGVGALAHELAHVFGLPDKYEDPDKSARDWCLLGTGYRGRKDDPEHKPLDLCADCRSRLGWLKEHRLDPRRDYQIVLEPVETSRRTLRIPLHRTGDESLLLEVRKGKGLIIWHSEKGKTTTLLGRFPTARTDRLTPYSEPSFRGRTVGSDPVYLTDIRFEDGKVYLNIGPKAVRTPLERLRRSRLGKTLGQR